MVKKLLDLLNFLWFVGKAIQAYKLAATQHGVYVAKTRNGVPNLAFIIARDREAWRVTDLALNHSATLLHTREGEE